LESALPGQPVSKRKRMAWDATLSGGIDLVSVDVLPLGGVVVVSKRSVGSEDGHLSRESTPAWRSPPVLGSRI